MLKSKKEIKTKYEDRKEKSNKWSGVAELKRGMHVEERRRMMR